MKKLLIPLAFLLVLSLLATGCPAPVPALTPAPALALAVTAPAPAPDSTNLKNKKPEEYVEKPVPSSIMPVVFLQGSDYEMGWQYGQQLGERIAARVPYWWTRASKAYAGVADVREAILKDLKAYEWYIKKDAPELVDMMKGMADGTTAAGYPVTYTDIVMINVAKSLKKLPDEAEYPPIPEDYEMGCAHTHAWGQTTKDGRLISTDNRDEFLTSQVCLVYYPETGNNYLTCTDVGQVACHPTMNNKGLFMGGSSGPGVRPIDKQYGLSRPLAFAHMGRFCNNAIEAKDWVLAHKCTWSNTINFSMADVHGNAFVCEHCPAITGVREPSDFGEVDFIFATNNYLLPETHVAGDKYAVSSEPRNIQIFDLLRNFTGEVDVDFMKMMYRNGQPEVHNIANKGTTRIVIAEVDDGDKGLINVCTGVPGRQTLLNLPINPTFSFYQITFAGSPAKVMSSAEQAATQNLKDAWVELMKLDYGDVEYAPLMELYAEAMEEYYRGFNVKDEAGAATVGAIEATEDETLYLYARATTHFTRCQAIARQVYNALMPPATTPEELGLTRPKPSIRWERPPHETEWEQILPK